MGGYVNYIGSSTSSLEEERSKVVEDEEIKNKVLKTESGSASAFLAAPLPLPPQSHQHQQTRSPPKDGRSPKPRKVKNCFQSSPNGLA